MIEEVIGQPIRRDLEKKPVKHLNLFLGLIGLELRVARTEKVGKQKVRYYALPVELVDRMIELARSFLKTERVREIEREERQGLVA
jgi:hypothetical protein